MCIDYMLILVSLSLSIYIYIYSISVGSLRMPPLFSRPAFGSVVCGEGCKMRSACYATQID